MAQSLCSSKWLVDGEQEGYKTLEQAEATYHGHCKDVGHEYIMVERTSAWDSGQ